MARKRTGVQSVHRALDALEIVSNDPHLNIRRIAHLMDLPVSTAHGLISTLDHRGYVTRTESGYALGPAAAGLSARWDPSVSLSLVLAKSTQSLTAETGLASAAAVLVGRSLRFLASEAAPGLITVRGASGQWAEPLSMSTGRVLVALGPRERWDDFIARAEEAETGWTNARWRSDLEHVRERRVGHLRPGNPRAVASIAVPVLEAHERPICAIGCSCPAFLAKDLTDPGILAALDRVAAEISRDLHVEPEMSRPSGIHDLDTEGDR